LRPDFVTFLEVHTAHLRKSVIIRTQIFSESALAALCGIALEKAPADVFHQLALSYVRIFRV